MPRPTPHLVIDARPRGPHGPLAVEHVLGRAVLAHEVDLAMMLGGDPIVVHARPEEHRRLRQLVGDWPAERVMFAPGPPLEAATILRCDRLYDPRRLRRAVRGRRDPETAVIWRLDRPGGLAGAEAELLRRRTYQPLGRFWALGPARLLARGLSATRVRPNALTLTAGALMLGAAATIALAPPVSLARGATAAALALALVLDTADGHLARLQGTASEFGRWLDALLDELSDMALHASIAWSAFARDHAPAWLILGMVYAMGKYVFVVGNESWRPEGEKIGAGSEPAHVPAPIFAATIWVRLAGHADVRWHLWIVLAAVGRLDAALIAYAVYFPARTLAGVLRKAVRHG
jgi:phosphatidylglycerophosphate synthase